MSDEKKPFARVDREIGALVIGGEVTEELVGGDWAQFEETAERINAAVEQREQSLLLAAAEKLAEYANAWAAQHRNSLFEADARLVRPDWERVGREIMKLTTDGVMAVSGHVACGLAFDVGMRQWEVHAMGAAWEALDCNEVGAARVISRFLVENGLRKPSPKRLTDLINELEMRDAAMTQRVADDGSGALEFTARWRVPKAELQYDGTTADVITRRTPLPAPAWASVPTGLPNVPSELRPGTVFGDQVTHEQIQAALEDAAGRPAPMTATEVVERQHERHMFIHRASALAEVELDTELFVWADEMVQRHPGQLTELTLANALRARVTLPRLPEATSSRPRT